MTKSTKWVLAAVLMASGWMAPAGAAEEDLFARAPWFGTLGLNYYHPEGDVEYDEGLGVFGKLGYSLNAWWDIEGSLNYMPTLDARPADQLNKPEYALDDDTSALRLGLDVLLHLRARETRRLDPFLRLGPAVTFLGDDVENGKTQLGVFAGAGLFYHFNDSWALRGDVVVGPQGTHTEFTVLAEIGVSYRFGAEKYVAPEFLVDAGPATWTATEMACSTRMKPSSAPIPTIRTRTAMACRMAPSISPTRPTRSIPTATSTG